MVSGTSNHITTISGDRGGVTSSTTLRAEADETPPALSLPRSDEIPPPPLPRASSLPALTALAASDSNHPSSSTHPPTLTTPPNAGYNVFVTLRPLSGESIKGGDQVRHSLMDIGIAHYMAVFQGPDGSLTQFDFGPQGGDIHLSGTVGELLRAGGEEVMARAQDAAGKVRRRRAAAAAAAAAAARGEGGSGVEGATMTTTTTTTTTSTSTMAMSGSDGVFGGATLSLSVDSSGSVAGGGGVESTATSPPLKTTTTTTAAPISRITSSQPCTTTPTPSPTCPPTPTRITHAPSPSDQAALLTAIQGKRKAAIGEIREEFLPSIPQFALYVGRTHLSLDQVREFSKLQHMMYELHRNDCRHYLNALVHHATGFEGASAMMVRHHFEQKRKNRLHLGDRIVGLAHVVTDVGNWERIVSGTQALVAAIALVTQKRALGGMQVALQRKVAALLPMLLASGPVMAAQRGLAAVTPKVVAVGGTSTAATATAATLLLTRRGEEGGGDGKGTGAGAGGDAILNTTSFPPLPMLTAMGSPTLALASSSTAIPIPTPSTKPPTRDNHASPPTSILSALGSPAKRAVEFGSRIQDSISSVARSAAAVASAPLTNLKATAAAAATAASRLLPPRPRRGGASASSSSSTTTTTVPMVAQASARMSNGAPAGAVALVRAGESSGGGVHGGGVVVGSAKPAALGVRAMSPDVSRALLSLSIPIDTVSPTSMPNSSSSTALASLSANQHASSRRTSADNPRTSLGGQSNHGSSSHGSLTSLAMGGMPLPTSTLAMTANGVTFSRASSASQLATMAASSSPVPAPTSSVVPNSPLVAASPATPLVTSNVARTSLTLGPWNSGIVVHQHVRSVSGGPSSGDGRIMAGDANGNGSMASPATPSSTSMASKRASSTTDLTRVESSSGGGGGVLTLRATAAPGRNSVAATFSVRRSSVASSSGGNEGLHRSSSSGLLMLQGGKHKRSGSSSLLALT